MDMRVRSAERDSHFASKALAMLPTGRQAAYAFALRLLVPQAFDRLARACPFGARVLNPVCSVGSPHLAKQSP